MSSRVVELTLCGTGVYTEQAEGSGKPTARLVLQEATTFDLFRALALNSAETSEEDHEKIKRNLKTMEAYLAERKEANARMEDMLKEKKREFFEHEERCALEKAEEAQRDCQDGGKGSVGKAEAEVKQAETEVRPFEPVSLLPLTIGSLLAWRAPWDYIRSNNVLVCELRVWVLRRQTRSDHIDMIKRRILLGFTT